MMMVIRSQALNYICERGHGSRRFARDPIRPQYYTPLVLGWFSEQHLELQGKLIKTFSLLQFL